MNYYFKAIRNYTNIHDRARRSEFWYFILFDTIFVILAFILDNILETRKDPSSGYGIISALYILATIIPRFTVSLRRLHDIGNRGWYLFLVFIPLIGIIWFIVLMATDGNIGENEYGSNPKENSSIKTKEEVLINNYSTNIDGKDLTLPINNSKNTKYENLGRIGDLLQKGIINKQEFEIEKKIILSQNAPIENKNQAAIKKISPIEIFMCGKINSEIKKAKSHISKEFDSKLVELLNEVCIDEKQTINFLDNYKIIFKSDLVADINAISPRLDSIKEYLTPLVNKGVLEPTFPYERIK